MNDMTHTSYAQCLEKGDTLFFEGDSSEYVYYVTQGSLEVYSDALADRTVLGQVMAGEFVGELGVLQESARNASVVALEKTYLQQYEQATFIESIAREPDKVINLLHCLSFRARNIALLSKQMAKSISEQEPKVSSNIIKPIFYVLTRIFNGLKKFAYGREQAYYTKTLPEQLKNGLHKINKGSVLFCEGGDSYYACRVVSGTFEAVKSLHNSFERINLMKAGEFIGEIGLLEGTPRSLTVVAAEDAEIEVFDQTRFLEVVAQNFDDAYELIKTLSARATKLHQHLRELMGRYTALNDPSADVQAKRLIQNIGDVSLLTGRMIERDLYKLQIALKQEASAVQDMMEIYYRYVAGEASDLEMEVANAEFRNFLKTLGLGALLIVPGSFITIPLVVKLSKSFGIDILPKHRQEHINL